MTKPINFNDPRVQRRCRSTLGFVSCYFNSSEPREASQAWLNKNFGQQQHRVSKWLRSNLLITRNYHYSSITGTCRSYILDSNGMEYVRARIDGKFLGSRRQWDQTKITNTDNNHFDVMAIEWGRYSFASELQTLNFTYEDKSHRLWHPLQMVRKPVKVKLQSEAGLTHHYDIQIASLSLLLQYSQQLPEELSPDGTWLRGPMDLWLFGIQALLKDRRYWRQRWANQIGVSEPVMKRIITALTAGARVCTTPYSSIYAVLGQDPVKLAALQQNPEINQFREDLRVLWDYVRRHQPHRTITTKSGVTRRLPLSSRDKWNIYFTLERRVLNSVRNYLDSNGIKYFLEHDGWATDQPIDQLQLQQAVLRDTGYQIQLEYHNYS